MAKYEKAVFFDRDGTINVKMNDGDYVKEWDEFEFVEDAVETLASIKKKGYLTILVTNQRCIAKGIISTDKLKAIHNNMQNELAKHNCQFDEIFFCPHDISDNCGCRKPKAGMLLEAERYYNIAKASSFLVGDTENDILAGISYGIRTIKIGSKNPLADYSAERLKGILNIID